MKATVLSNEAMLAFSRCLCECEGKDLTNFVLRPT
jgi:hypothetical protein